MQHPSGQVPMSRPVCCACCWTWHCQEFYLLLVTGLSLRGLKDTWDGLLAVPQVSGAPSQPLGETWAGVSNPQPWHGEACICPRLLITAAREPGARSRPVTREGLALSAPQPPARSPLPEENDLSWQEEHSQDFLEQSAEPALEERLPKNPGSNSLRLMPSCLPSDLDTIKLMET